LFYTDGWADYPDKEIRELNKSLINFRFYGYSESTAEHVFKMICKELRGQMNENVETEQVGNSFISVMDILKA